FLGLGGGGWHVCVVLVREGPGWVWGGCGWVSVRWAAAVFVVRSLWVEIWLGSGWFGSFVLLCWVLGCCCFVGGVCWFCMCLAQL
ncbi:hypothetical protein, partial [Pseudomonas syringae group genomosp. 7]|uniref:hypothetical protein n=1 Tax=Pseudomonas syringae group genomosp. 7 TaxID=251699 RepID=UPI00376FBF7B